MPLEKIDIVLQGPYNNDFVNEIALHYLALAFVNNILKKDYYTVT